MEQSTLREKIRHTFRVIRGFIDRICAGAESIFTKIDETFCGWGPAYASDQEAAPEARRGNLVVAARELADATFKIPGDTVLAVGSTAKLILVSVADVVASKALLSASMGAIAAWFTDKIPAAGTAPLAVPQPLVNAIFAGFVAGLFVLAVTKWQSLGRGCRRWWGAVKGYAKAQIGVWGWYTILHAQEEDLSDFARLKRAVSKMLE